MTSDRVRCTHRLGPFVLITGGKEYIYKIIVNKMHTYVHMYLPLDNIGD